MIAAGRLGAIERLVGPGQPLLRGLHLVGKTRQPQADGDPQLGRAHPDDLPGNGGAQPLAESERALLGGAGQDRAEFLAALATADIDLPRRFTQQACHQPDRFITHRMAVVVVDAFEVIDVEHHQRGGLAGALHPLPFLL